MKGENKIVFDEETHLLAIKYHPETILHARATAYLISFKQTGYYACFDCTLLSCDLSSGCHDDSIKFENENYAKEEEKT